MSYFEMTYNFLRAPIIQKKLATLTVQYIWQYLRVSKALTLI